jgi:hypothetical protein
MEVTEAAKIKISNCLGYSAKSAFFSNCGLKYSLRTPRLPQIKKCQGNDPHYNMILRGSLLYPKWLTLKLEHPIFRGIFISLNQALFFSWAKNLNSAKIMLWRINLSLQKHTVCDQWTKIVAKSWFGTRIYPRALTLGC